MATQYREVEHEGHRYRQKDVTRTPEQSNAWRFVGWRKPLRQTSFKGLEPGSPTIHPLETQNLHQLKAPVMVRRLSDDERRDKRRQNMAIGVTGGAFAGASARRLYRSATGAEKNPNSARGVIRQLKQTRGRGPVNWGEAGRSLRGRAGRNAVFLGGGALAGGALAAAKNARAKRTAEYGSAYSTEGMKPLKESRR